MKEKPIKPTIEDVAQYCGVSISTVSRVINQSAPVSENLKIQVLKAIKDLGFTPRQWKEQTATKTILMAVPDVLNPFYAELLNGAQEEAERQGMRLLFLNLSENPDQQEYYLESLNQWMFDGLVIAGTRLSADYLTEFRAQRQLPMVLTRSMEVPGFPCIIADYRTSTFQAVKYLLSLNHTRIAYISGPPEWISSKVRLEGVRQALAEAQLALPDELYRWSYANIEESLHTVGNLLALPDHKRPTAIIAFDDLIAIGALRAIHNKELRVPQDISVVGHDDNFIAAYTIPSLTTIAQPTYRVGQLAVKKLYDQLQDPSGGRAGTTVLVECPLIVRESTGPCPE